MEREERMRGMMGRKKRWELDEWDRHGIEWWRYIREGASVDRPEKEEEEGVDYL